MSTKKKILVSRRVFPDVIERLSEHFEVDHNEPDHLLTPAELAARLQGCEGVFITGSDKIDAALLDACPQLKAVCAMTVGYNNIDVAACTARGVRVSNAPDVLTETTADFGFALMMATARRIAESEHYLRSGQWSRWAIDMFAGSDIHGATLGILGMGRIGQAIAKRGHLGFGMNVLYHNRSRLAPELEAPLGARWVTKDDLLQQADHVVLVLPYTPENHHTIGARELGLMKDSAILVNVARGAIVDERSLYEHLLANPGFSAGIDAWWDEPRGGAPFHTNYPFFELPNLLGSPHNSGDVPGIMYYAARQAAGNVRRYLVGDAVSGVARREDYAKLS